MIKKILEDMFNITQVEDDVEFDYKMSANDAYFYLQNALKAGIKITTKQA